MIHEHGAGGALVLERARDRRRVATPDRPRARMRRADTTVATPAGTYALGSTPGAAAQTPAGTRGTFRSPCLLLVAGIAIYLGYRSTGVITTGQTHWAVLADSRPTALVEGAFLLAAALLLTRPVRGPQGRDRAQGRSAVAVGVVGLVVFLASVVVAADGGRSAGDVLGIAELAFAAVSIGVVVGSERHRQRGLRRVAR